MCDTLSLHDALPISWAGRVTSWADGYIETPEQESWLRNAVETGLTQILEDKPE
jgi:hypothetical protein